MAKDGWFQVRTNQEYKQAVLEIAKGETAGNISKLITNALEKRYPQLKALAVTKRTKKTAA